MTTYRGAPHQKLILSWNYSTPSMRYSRYSSCSSQCRNWFLASPIGDETCHRMVADGYFLGIGSHFPQLFAHRHWQNCTISATKNHNDKPMVESMLVIYSKEPTVEPTSSSRGSPISYQAMTSNLISPLLNASTTHLTHKMERFNGQPGQGFVWVLSNLEGMRLMSYAVRCPSIPFPSSHTCFKAKSA